MAAKITKIGITSDKISGRGGIALFLAYVDNIGLYALISNHIRPLLVLGLKGLGLEQFLKQIFAFFIDGTDSAISGFDKKKKDEGYAAVLENDLDQQASSHQIKRFFLKMALIPNSVFNFILHELFIWRLKMVSPKIIILGIDTMVLNNDDADKREGCEPTYKKKKGFQPLHLCWGPFLIDVLFRKGSAHSNHGTDYSDRVTAVVNLIRTRYNPDVPIVLCADSGFADQKAYHVFESLLHVSYITTGKLYPEVKDYVRELQVENFNELSKNNAIWKYTEFGHMLKSWSKVRRCIFTKLERDQKGQSILEFAKPDSIIFTNIGLGGRSDEYLKKAGMGSYFQTEKIIETSHQRGADELIHRSIKELATKEQLPFKSFSMNQSYYLLLVITHFMFEAHKQDVTVGVIPVTSYPNTYRRKIIDIAVKVTSSARSVCLRFTQTIFDTINIVDLWAKCQNPENRIMT
ncbi:hypothetical protein MNBD_GAMMA12-1151 [hydrothermal vent metagenome]|uniref:Transposase DDE domain-containing protein n=1 Tax=hydrothermal vent metagenome TaxID=652676 RepID=A0A3B0Y3E2_9ZZZZ